MPYTFWQLPLGCRGSGCGSRRFGLLGADWGASAGIATHHRHGVVITTGLQGIPVGDKGEPAVLSLQCHLERHEALQVHVAGEKGGRCQIDKMHTRKKPCTQKTNTRENQVHIPTGGWKKAPQQALTQQKHQLHQLSWTPVVLRHKLPAVISVNTLTQSSCLVS